MGSVSRGFASVLCAIVSVATGFYEAATQTWIQADRSEGKNRFSGRMLSRAHHPAAVHHLGV